MNDQKLQTPEPLMKNSNPGLWLDEFSASAWSTACQREIEVWLGALAGNEASALDLHVEVFPPGQEQARAAFLENTDLHGSVCCVWEGQRIELTAPMPFNGLFFAHRPDFQRSLVSVWPSWLGEAPGFRVMRPASEATREKLRWRLGLPGGRYLQATLKRMTSKEARDLSEVRYFGSATRYPDWLAPHLSVLGLRRSDAKGSASWDDVQRTIQQHATKEEPSDESDLCHRVLMSFPVWLKHRIARVLLNAAQREPSIKQAVAHVLAGAKSGSQNLVQQAWAAIQKRQGEIINRIEWAIHNQKSADHVEFVDPINPLDLISRITRVRRFALPSSKLACKEAAVRQNHPSFRGRLCPLESPESELVGLSLQLASGAKVDLEGTIQPALDAAGELGFGARLVPFFGHNDGARNMMGAKNLRQAVPIRGSERAIIETGGEEVVARLAEPLVSLGVCPNAKPRDGNFALGRDLLVAYIPWHGLNFEDAVVLGHHVAEAGIFDLSLSQSFRRRIKRGWIPADPPEQVVLPWSQNGLAMVGAELVAGSPLASFSWEGKAEMKPLRVCYENRSPAVLRSIRFQRLNEWTDGVLDYKLEIPIRVKPGDKLMGRHGNKGVVGAVLPTNRMPRLPNDDTLPKELRGRTIDLLLNPHGVISRMNLGQLLETHIGWLLHSGKCKPADLLKEGATDTDFAAPFANELDHEKVRNLFRTTGLDEYGRIQLELPGGGKTLAPVVVGFQHIVRLRHIPELKSQARRGGREALYSARTGQAVRGRKQGGGQRVGEMEIWSLAAHQADAVISEILGVKSSVELVTGHSPTAELVQDKGYTGYQRTLEDWLFALLINLEVQGGEVRFGFANASTVLQYAGPWGKVSSPVGLRVAPTARFGCSRGGSKPCGFRLIEDARIAFPTTSGGREKKAPVLCLGDFLDQLGLKADEPLVPQGNEFALPLIDLHTGLPTEPLLIEFNHSGKQLVARMRVNAMHRPSRWPIELKEIALYAQLSAGDGKNWGANELLLEFTRTKEEKLREGKQGKRAKGTRSRSIREMRLACPDHPTSPLTGRKPFGQAFCGAPGGLFDRLIFGSGHGIGGSLTASRWGYISLPVKVPYPLHAFLTPINSLRNQTETVQKFLNEHGIVSSDLPCIELLPVLPIRYRAPSFWRGALAPNPIDNRYKAILSSCARYDKESDPHRQEKISAQIAGQVADLFRLFTESLQDKHGLIRRDGLGRRVDRSARLVITPNPTLGWDQVGIPASVLIETMGDLVETWAANRTDAEKSASPIPSLPQVSWPRLCEDAQSIRSATTALDAFLQAHPDFVVLLNRQPSLHRDSFQAFHPVPIPPEAGEVIQLCPLACKGFGADFDGDEMVVHIPIGKRAQEQATHLLPSNNPLSLGAEAPDNVLAHFDQDLVLGSWWIGAGQPDGILSSMLEVLPADCCREIVSANGRLAREDTVRLLSHIALKHPKQAARTVEIWMRKAFEACTLTGVSFGFYEMLEVAEGIFSEVQKLCENPQDRSNDALLALAIGALNRVLHSGFRIADPCVHFAAMAISGARGEKQIRQILAARGALDPGATCFRREEARFFFKQSLIHGMGVEEAFNAAMNARSSMCDKKLGTAYAGGLTRNLVFALWPHAIVSNDCGSSAPIRNPATCLEKHGFCSACYGPLPNGSMPKIGFPAGLIAAQSIGERGTQLSMQSFHGSESVVNIHSVRELFGVGLRSGGTRQRFEQPVDAGRFVADLKQTKAYRNLPENHLYVLWKVLHSHPDHRIPAVISTYDGISRLAYRNAPREILLAGLKNDIFSRENPLCGILLGGISGNQEHSLA